MHKLLVMCLVLLIVVTGCGKKSFPYQNIPDVPHEVNDLGRMIGQAQRDVVEPGGDQWHPGFSDRDRRKFEDSDKLDDIVEDVTSSRTFRNGVEALQQLPPETQEMVLRRYNTPIYPTWAMNGAINDHGTTDAGYDVELAIATALTDAVREELQSTEE